MKHLTFIFCAALLPAQIYQNRATVREGPTNLCGTATGTNTITCSMSPAIAGYVTGNEYTFVATGANTGAVTLNINSRGAVAIKKNGDAALVANDIKTGQVVTVRHDGTNFQMVSHLGNASSGGGSALSTPWEFHSGGIGITYQNSILSGSALTGICHRRTLPFALTSTAVKMEVGVASGTCGGTCGFVFGLYDSSKALIASTAVMTSGGSPNFNTAGVKSLAWASGSAVTSGTLTLQPGKYYGCVLTDSTTAQIRWLDASWALIANGGTTGGEHGYASSFGTGAGATVALPSSISGVTFTAASTGLLIPVLFIE